MVRILLADDHTLVRETLAGLLGRLDEDVSVDEASGLSEVRTLIQSGNEYDLIILDLVMPGMDGLNGVKTVLEARPETPVVILSGDKDRKKITSAISLGAKGFIPKTIAPKGMLNALRLVLSGETYVPEMVLTKEPPEPATGADDEKLPRLTPRETEVLTLLVRGYRNKKIAKELGVEEVTVKVHLYHLFQKLGVSSRAEAIVVSLRLGLCA